MREDHPDATTLLATSIAGVEDFDPDSPSAKASLERILMAPPLPAAGAQARRTQARKLALAAVPLTLVAGGGLTTALSLSDSPSGIAKASVIAHAASALDQPGTITYLKVKFYSAHNPFTCLPAGRPLQEGTPAFSGCLDPLGNTLQEASRREGISANPAEDTLTYSSEEWSSPNGSEERVLFGDGDETISNTNTSEYETFAAADNEVTTLTAARSSDLISPCRTPIGPPLSASALASPSCYETLYEQARTGQQHVKLIGQTTIEGTSVYELEFDFDPQPPKNPPAGDMCGKSVCVPPDIETLLYLNSASFIPVRVVDETVNSDDRPGVPSGTTVSSVTDFAMESLPDTPGNEDLLQMPSHPGASRIEETEAHYNSELVAALKALTDRHAH